MGQNEPFVVPLYALVAAPVAGLVIGAVAGLYPAAKAARLSPDRAPPRLGPSQSALASASGDRVRRRR